MAFEDIDDTIAVFRNQNSPHSIPRLKAGVSCTNCNQLSICLPGGLNNDQLSEFENLVSNDRVLNTNGILYRQNDLCDSIYAIQSGSIKLATFDPDGSSRIRGFYFPGHVIGFDGIAAGRYCSDAKALEDTRVCEINFEQLCQLSRSLPALQKRFMRLMSEEITSEQKLMRLMGKGFADQRVAAFLLVISENYRLQLQSSTCYELPMSRTDIASYLGINLETLSRTLSNFANQGFISVSRARINILNFEGLRAITGNFSLDDKSSNALKRHINK